MFANLLQLITRRPPADYGRGFVQEVSVSTHLPRNRRVERLILAGWVLILGKSYLMIWLIDKYHVPFNANWVIVPTVLFALLCTAVYFWRD